MTRDRFEDEPMKNSSLQRYMLVFSFVVLFFVVAPLRPQGQARPFDIVIINGRIIDGTGSPWNSGDFAILGGHVGSIHNSAPAPPPPTSPRHPKTFPPSFTT